MHANNLLLRSRKDTVFLLSLLRDHPAFHDATALREKKDALSGATPLLLGTTAPVYAFMTVDFLIHRFFAGLTGLSEDEYRELALDFFDGANLGIMEVLSLIYLQNAASLPRVDQRREAFLKRRNLVSQVGVFIPEMDEWCGGDREKEGKMANSAEVGELSKKISPELTMPAPILSASRRLSVPRAFGKPIFAICLVFLVLWALFGGFDHRLAMVDINQTGVERETQTTKPDPASNPDSGIKTGSGDTHASSDPKTGTVSIDASFDWLAWSFWRNYADAHSREILVTLMSGLGVMVTGIFLGLKEVLRNGVIRLCQSAWSLVSVLPRAVLLYLSRRTYLISLDSPFWPAANLWSQVLHANPAPISNAIMSLVDALGREVHEFDVRRTDGEVLRNEIIEEAKKALDRLRKERG